MVGPPQDAARASLLAAVSSVAMKAGTDDSLTRMDEPAIASTAVVALVTDAIVVDICVSR